MKKAIVILSLCVFSLSAQARAAQQDPLKDSIHNYLKDYQVLINYLYGNVVQGDRMRVGDPNKMFQNLAFLHMSEVIDLIVSGKLDECCYHSTPAVYSQYANATTAQILSGATIYNPGTGTDFKIPSYLGVQMFQLLQQMNIVAGDLAPSADLFNNISLTLMQDLSLFGYVSPESMLGQLIWGWSYIDTVHSSLEPSFKDYYIYGCVVCDGAGFYDTHDLYHTNPNTGNLYYDEIVTPSNLPKTYEWLQQQAASQGERPPLQSSIGLTFQGQAEDTEQTLSDGVIYPTHCHQAEELYFALDPMQLSKVYGSTILEGSNGYTYDTDSYGIGAINYLNLPIQFMPDLSSQFPQNFMTLRNGDIIYNESLAYHAFNAGRRFQFTQWSRLTWPQEGTYFPLNGGPNPPPGVQCAAKPSVTRATSK